MLYLLDDQGEFKTVLLQSLEGVAWKGCWLRMSLVGLLSGVVGERVGVSSCLRVSSSPGVGVQLGVSMSTRVSTITVGTSLSPARAAGGLVVQSADFIPRSTGEGSLKFRIVRFICQNNVGWRKVDLGGTWKRAQSGRRAVWAALGWAPWYKKHDTVDQTWVTPEPRPTIPDSQTSCNVSWTALHLLETSEEGVSWVGMSWETGSLWGDVAFVYNS